MTEPQQYVMRTGITKELWDDLGYERVLEEIHRLCAANAHRDSIKLLGLPLKMKHYFVDVDDDGYRAVEEGDARVVLLISSYVAVDNK